MVSKSLCYSLLGQNFHLLPEKAIFWEEEQTLILSDIHLGKAGHFRKSGFAIPQGVHLHDLVTLESIIERWQPAKVLIIGDLFHSEWNAEWLLFSDWLEQFTSVRWVLVKGNHDILPAAAYRLSCLQIVADKWESYPFVFTHEPVEPAGEWYNISGHIHPAVRLTGRGRQHLVLPCFYFGCRNGILPAFGKFTGMATIQAKTGDTVFVISAGGVTRVC
ncbi:ligase-associated DNA damage response endonuclease PdeM [Rhodoflexus caldus]|uniref:ligase-associated DNA damage response endonuclease PdeM n=1 Tax=Rhodoflexus caldus TaxID=2891236 RepID=UPI00202A5F65|nr:ligase-associated DNA damage response endonuclease PdeM [Rhodoflexus caldus]